MSNPALIARIALLSRSALTDGRTDAAETYCRLGLMLDAHAAVLLHHLGLCALIRDDVAAALPFLDDAVGAYADEAGNTAEDAHRDRVVALLLARRDADALDAAREAARRWPNSAPIARLCAQAAEKRGDSVLASEHYARALAATPETDPDRAEIAFSLGTAEYARHRLSDAYAAFRAAIAADRRHARAWCNLGAVLSDMARPAEALKAFEAALAIDPGYRHAHGNALHTLHYLPGQSAQTLLTAHRAFAARHFPDDPPRPEPPGRARPLIGLVSEDLRSHPVGYFCAGWLPFAAEAGFDVAVYSSARAEDGMTAAMKPATTLWREVRELDDDALVRVIRADAPDLLIDLAGHTGRNRLGVFARRAAALQATWMGYVGTTGLPQIDGLIADRVHVPRLEESAYVESVWRMPNGYVCYAPPAYAPKPLTGAAKRNGYVSFAAFHNPAKINPDLIAAWAKILSGVPEARIRMAFRGLDDPQVKDAIVRTFQARGIAAERLDVRGQLPHAELLGLYNDCDFALDSFPYAGGLTTLEALWMGIPVIAAPGATFASRHAASHVTFAGFGAELATGPSDYVRTAIAWANSPAMLGADRAARRARFSASPLLDGRRFAADFRTLLANALAQPR